jgi:hypothetical protein
LFFANLQFFLKGFIIETSGRNETNTHAEEFHIINVIYSIFKDEKYNFPFLKCGLCIETSFQREQYEKGGKRVTSQRRNLTNTTVAK